MSFLSIFTTASLLLLPVPCEPLASSTDFSRAIKTGSSSSSPVPSKIPLPLSQNQKALDEGPRFPRTWVPLGSVIELNPDRPTPVTFLNQKYVIFKGDHDQWVVMDDICPHRLAPLSEGRIDTNAGERRVECSYHGWSFDSSGTCKDIPQATNRIKASAMANPKCHVKSYSTQVVKSILWAWLWKEDAVEEALNDPSITPQQMLDGVQNVIATYTRDMPYGWDTLTENLVDPAHIPFAHHNLQGTRSDAIAINMTMTEPVTKSGFVFEHVDRTMKKIRHSKAVFKAPFTLTYGGVFETDKPKPQYFNLTTIGIPSRPGWNRAMILTALPSNEGLLQDDAAKASKGPQQSSPSWRSKLFTLFPVWLVHILSNRFLDSDMALLHYQEQEREKQGGDSDERQGGVYFMPSTSDRSVNAFRKWKNKYASVLLPLPPAIHSRTVLFDRYTQHTEQCLHCSKALKQVRKLRVRAVGVLSLGGILVATRFPILGCVVVTGCLATIGVLNTLEQGFVTGGFNHYENE
ncbi:hypothetical protein ACA910_009001 [Epithemia clementina (nom. ined.)]